MAASLLAQVRSNERLARDHESLRVYVSVGRNV